ncbi:MAG: PIN domain-containing protein [Candidatus Tectomicrobia bacterium]|nr:PIN domain-containing protein [Candidatus Tectomicrobia bacterium]
MAEVFADTSGWASFFVRTEPIHALAVAYMQQWHANGTQVVTTNYILAELIALLTSPLRIPRPRQVTTIDTIKTASWVEVVHIDLTSDEEAWILLRERLDKTWSLVDCSSFTVMRHRDIREALTTDHHFGQAGFGQLLK